MTVVEVLGEHDKMPGPDRLIYLNRRDDLLNRSIHLVEIDLRRGGPRMPDVANLESCDYLVLVARNGDRSKWDVRQFSLRAPFPVIPILVREPIGEIHVDLQKILHTVYDNGYYKDFIYESGPDPPLCGADVEWASALAKTR